MNILKQQGTTLVQRACAKVNGFKALHNRQEKKIIVSGPTMMTILTFDRRGPPDSDHINMIRNRVIQNRRAEIPQA